MHDIIEDVMDMDDNRVGNLNAQDLVSGDMIEDVILILIEALII